MNSNIVYVVTVGWVKYVGVGGHIEERYYDNPTEKFLTRLIATAHSKVASIKAMVMGLR